MLTTQMLTLLLFFFTSWTLPLISKFMFTSALGSFAIMQLKAQKVRYVMINFILVKPVIFFFNKNNQISYAIVNSIEEEIKHSPPALSCL